MKYSIEDIVKDIVLTVFSTLNFTEYTEKIALFLLRYMPVSGVTLHCYSKGTITKLASYLIQTSEPVPDSIQMPKDICEKTHSDPYFNSGFFEIKSYTTEDNAPYAKFVRTVYKEKAACINIPLDYYTETNTYFFIIVHAVGACCYTQDHLELCGLLRHPLAHAFSKVFMREREPAAANQTASLAMPHWNPSGNEAILPLDEYIKAYIKRVLAQTNGRVGGKNGAAELLGLNTSTLWSKIRKLNIDIYKDA